MEVIVVSMNRHLWGLVLGLLLVSMTGCAWLQNYGKLRLQPCGGEKVAIGNLLDNWTAYHVYYSGIQVYRPSSVMFDPKDDDRTLVPHEWWVKVEDKKILTEVVDWLNFDRRLEPLIWRIMGPNDEIFGYMYTPWNHVLIKVIDPKTLWVDDMSKSLEFHAIGEVDREAQQQ